jgi:hypothetical protein
MMPSKQQSGKDRNPVIINFILEGEKSYFFDLPGDVVH